MQGRRIPAAFFYVAGYKLQAAYFIICGVKQSGGYMTDRELRRLSRAELLEMLLAQIEKNEKLDKRLKAAEAALAERQIVMEQSGTLAEAALRLNGVFEAADQAARQYLENIRAMSQESRDRL